MRNQIRRLFVGFRCLRFFCGRLVNESAFGASVCIGITVVLFRMSECGLWPGGSEVSGYFCLGSFFRSPATEVSNLTIAIIQTTIACGSMLGQSISVDSRPRTGAEKEDEVRRDRSDRRRPPRRGASVGHPWNGPGSPDRRRGSTRRRAVRSSAGGPRVEHRLWFFFSVPGPQEGGAGAIFAWCVEERDRGRVDVETDETRQSSVRRMTHQIGGHRQSDDNSQSIRCWGQLLGLRLL